MTIHRGSDLRFRRPGHFRQKLGSFNDHSVVTVAALHGLFVNECLLYGMESGSFLQTVLPCVPDRKSFECRDRFPLQRSHRRYARAYFNAVHQDRAGAALRQSTTKSRALQEQFVREHVQQRCVRTRSHRPNAFVYFDFETSGHFATPRSLSHVWLNATPAGFPAAIPFIIPLNPAYMGMTLKIGRPAGVSFIQLKLDRVWTIQCYSISEFRITRPRPCIEELLNFISWQCGASRCCGGWNHPGTEVAS